MNKIQFSGLYRFYAQKTPVEMRACAQPQPNPTSVRYRLQGKMNDVVFHEVKRDSFFSVPLQGIKEIPAEDEPDYQGAMITEADLKDFWFAFAPDTFTPEMFQEGCQLRDVSDEKRQALDEHLHSRVSHEAGHGKKRKAFMGTVPFADVLTPLLFRKDAQAGKSFTKQYEKLKADADEAEAKYKQFCRALDKKAHLIREQVRVGGDQARFEAAVFDFVENHPMDATSHARKEMRV